MIMRPPKLKTTLSVLRNMLTLGQTTKSVRIPKTGRWEKVSCPAPLTKKKVASWLNLAVSTVEKIESGAEKLTEENARIIARQTAAPLDWLRGGDPTKPIVFNVLEEPYTKNEPYTQKHFEDRQKDLSSPDANLALHLDLEYAQMDMALSCGKIAAILARGVGRGEAFKYAMKLDLALRSVYFDEDEKPQVWPRGFEPAGGYNMKPTMYMLAKRAREIHREKQGGPCPACGGQGVITCPEWSVPRGKINETILTDDKTGKPVMRLGKLILSGPAIAQARREKRTNRVIPCEKCKGKGRV